MNQRFCLIRAVIFLVLSAAPAGAFSLLGPYASWMDQTNGYRQPDDIGGPMDINEEYRWNVPVVTYAFDPSFLDYFGSNGVAAVEQAIGILNDLPPASRIDLANFPLEARFENYRAAADNLYDLKTATLGLLLEQMGLTQPIRYVFALRRFDWNFFVTPDCYYLDELTWPPGTIPEYILERNYDPETATPSHWVNGLLFSSYIRTYPDVTFATMENQPVDGSYLFSNPFTPVAAYDWYKGQYCQTLTQDDVGGLRYLLASNNINYEVLLPDIQGAGTNAENFINGALRPGVEKVTFVRQDFDAVSARIRPITNDYIDTYFTNGVAMYQQVQRVVREPDLLFCAGDPGGTSFSWPVMRLRTGTTNWWNSSTNIGPGVIRPPIKITFNRSFQSLVTSETSYYPWFQSFLWASYDGTTNAPITYDCTTPRPQTPLRLRLHFSGHEPTTSFEWQLPLSPGSEAVLQASTDLSTWVSCAEVTNQGIPVEWYHYPSGPNQFFRILIIRLVPQ